MKALGGDIPVDGAGSGEPNDLEFLRCEQAQPVRRRRTGGHGLSRRAQLGPGPHGRGSGPGPVEERERGAQVSAGIRAPPTAAQPFAVEELGAAVVERTAADRVLPQRLAVVLFRVTVPGEGLAAVQHGPCPRLAGGPGPGGEAGQRLGSAIGGTGYPMVWLLLLASGLGVAMFITASPPGRRGRSASAMSIFAAGGSVGFFLAPVLATPALASLGLGATALFIPPAMLIGLFLLRHHQRAVASRGAQIHSRRA